MDIITIFDFKILDWIAENLRNPFLDAVIPNIRWLGEYGILWITVALVLIAIPKYRRLGVSLGLSFLLGLLLVNIGVKSLVCRVRPYEINRAAELLIPAAFDSSFPSCHTLVCAEATTVFFALKYKKAGVFAAIVTVLMAFSRVYSYIHYPSDVIAGIIIGICIGFAGIFIVRAVCRKCPKINKLIEYRNTEESGDYQDEKTRKT